MQEHNEDVAVFKLEQLFGKRDASGVERLGADARALEQPRGIGGDEKPPISGDLNRRGTNRRWIKVQWQVEGSRMLHPTPI